MGERFSAGACDILVVDDDLSFRETAQYMLQRACKVEVAATAEAAMELVRRKVFDVVVTDVRLPGKSGLELLQYVKEHFPSTAVIVMSVIDDVTVAVEAMRLGAYYYTTKQFDWDALPRLVLSAADAGTSELEKLRQECLRLRRENATLRESGRIHVPNIEDRRRSGSDRRQSRQDETEVGSR